MRQVVKVLAVALIVSAVWTLPAQAALRWFTCDVDLAGMPTSTLLVLQLTHRGPAPLFTVKSFRVTTPNVKEIFATALTAMATNQPIAMLTDLDSAAVPLLLRFYLLKE